MRAAAPHRWPIALIGLLALLPLGASAAAPAARVEFTTGPVTAVDLQGVQRPLRKGDTVAEGDTVNTSSGRAQLRFTDGSFVALQPDSLFRIDQYRFDVRARGEERGFFALLKGGMRTITGLVGRTDKRNYKVETAVATIGIRGTEYTIQYGNSVRGTVGEGEISACNAGGCLNIASGQSFLVTDPQTIPVLTAVRTSLPPPQPSAGPTQPANAASGDQTTASGQSRSLSEAQSSATRTTQTEPKPTDGMGDDDYGEHDSDGETDESGPFPTVRQLTDGRSYALAYARNSGAPRLDTIAEGNGSAAFGSRDELRTFAGPGSSAINVRDFAQAPDTLVAESGASGSVIGWGRWMSAYLAGNERVALGPGEGFHYIVARPGEPVLTRGEATYTLIGGTQPTGNDGGNPGKLNSATLFVSNLGGPARVALEFNLSYAQQTYNVSTPGGANRTGASEAGMRLSGQGTFAGTNFVTTGCLTPGACGAEVQGLFAPERAGFVYSIVDGGSAQAVAVDGPAAPRTVTGAAVLAPQAPTPIEAAR